jgi:hypothetical protein
MEVHDVQIASGTRFVHWGGSYALPERFSAIVELAGPNLPVCRLDVAVEDGRAVCERLVVDRGPGGRPVTGTTLRAIPVGELVKVAADRVARLALRAPVGERPTVTLDDGEEHPLFHERIDNEWVAVPLGGIARSGQYQAETRNANRRGRGRITDQELRNVASVYRTAYLKREAPTAAVARELHVSRSTAGRYVHRARERGFLGPTRQRVAGENL